MNPQQYTPQPGQGSQGYPPQGPPGGQNGYPPQPGQPYQPQPGSSGAMPPQYQPQHPPQPQQYMGPPGNMGGMAPPPPMNGYNPYPYPDEYALAPKKGPNKLVLAVIAILGIMAVAIAVLTLTADNGNKTGNTPQNQTPAVTEDKSAKDVIDRSDGTLDLSSKLTLSKSLKAQRVQGNINQQVNLSSGFSFMVNKIEDYTSPNPTTKPATGKKFIVLTTVVGNRLNTGNLSVSYLDFRLRDANNNIIPGHVTTNEILSNLLSSPSEIKPGAQITGKVIFEVEAIDTSWVYRHSETYQKTTDNTTFNVEGEIVVSQSTATSETFETDTSTTPTPTPVTN